MKDARAWHRSDLVVYVALFFQAAISAGTHLVAKRAVTELSPATVILWRFLLSAAAYGVLLAFTPGPKLPPRAAWRTVLWLGFLAGPVNQFLFLIGLRLSIPAHAALLYALTPTGVYALALARRQETPRRTATLGIATALFGVLVLLLGGGLASLRGVFLGDVIILFAVVAWVLFTADGKAFIATHGALRAIAWSMICGALWVAPLAPFYLQPSAMLHATHVEQLSIVYLALLGSFVSYVLFYFALGRAEASRVAVFSNLQPVITALASWKLLNNPLHWELFVGGALVLLGVRLTQRS